MDTTQETSKLVVNQHYDESVEVDDQEEVASVYSPAPLSSSALEKSLLPVRQASRQTDRMSVLSDAEDVSTNEYRSHENPKVNDKVAKLSPGTNSAVQKSVSEGDSEDTESSSSEDNAEALTGSYDPSEYEHLTVSQEIKELFQYIARYTPQAIQLEHKLKPFNPDYIPAVGDIDAFLKVPRPDKKSVMLGLTVLDEPCAKQSDPTVLDLLLRSVSKTAGVRSMTVRSIKNAEQSPKAIDNWIESINELHRTKPPPSVHYNKSMPEIDYLMQEWPTNVENLLPQLKLPTANLDCSLQTYSDIICSILDVPTYKNRIHSLHVVFSLYAAVKEFQENHNIDSNERYNAVDEMNLGSRSPPSHNYR